jgi:hypothetical protein
LAVLFFGYLRGPGALGFSLFDLYPAFPAEGLSAAGGLDIYPRFHRRLEQVLSRGNFNFPVMRLKTNEHSVRQKDWLLLNFILPPSMGDGDDGTHVCQNNGVRSSELIQTH